MMILFYLNLFFMFTNLMIYVTTSDKLNLMIGVLNLVACISLIRRGSDEKK